MLPQWLSGRPANEATGDTQESLSGTEGAALIFRHRILFLRAREVLFTSSLSHLWERAQEQLYCDGGRGLERQGRFYERRRRSGLFHYGHTRGLDVSRSKLDVQGVAVSVAQLAKGYPRKIETDAAESQPA